MQLFSYGKHGPRARAPNDDVAQHGGLTQVNTKSCSFGLQRLSLIYGPLTPVRTRYPLTSVM